MKQQALLGMFGTYEARVQADLSLAMPPDLASRLEGLMAAVPGTPKRSVVLTGVELLIETCEKDPGLAQQLVKAAGLHSRGKVCLSVKIPLDLDEQLSKFLASNGISRRAAAAAGINLVVSKCEQVNGGPFVMPDSPEIEK